MNMTEKTPLFSVDNYWPEMLSNDDWDDYMADFDANTMWGSRAYLLCTEHFIQTLDDILANSKNPQEVVENLTKLRADRYTFLASTYPRSH